MSGISKLKVPLANWGVINLGELCGIKTGKRDVNEGNPHGNYPFFTCAREHTYSDSYSFDTSAILIAGNGDVGHVQRYEGKFEAYQRTYVLFGFAGIHLNFLYHVLAGTLKAALFDQKLGNTMPYIKVGMLRDFPIPVPPLAEQERIVGILDEAFEGIATATAHAERNLANARELFQSVLQSTFEQTGEDWVETTLPDVCSDYGRGKSKHRPRNEPKLYGGPYPFIQTGDLTGADHILATYKQTYSEMGLNQSKLWPEGTVCVAIVGATVGESGILGFEACFPDSIIGFAPDTEKALSSFIEYLLQSAKALLKEKGKGTARDNINLGTFADQPFSFPPLETQHQIVEKLDALAAETRRLEAVYERKLAALAELKQSLLQRAFAGEL